MEDPVLISLVVLGVQEGRTRSIRTRLGGSEMERRGVGEKFSAGARERPTCWVLEIGTPSVRMGDSSGKGLTNLYPTVSYFSDYIA